MSHELDTYHEHYGRSMHICPSCDSGLVQPEHWSSAGNDLWRVWLRCPECEWKDDDIYSLQEVEDYDEVLDAGVIRVSESLKLLTKENMERDLGVLVLGLQKNAILPEDF